MLYCSYAAYRLAGGGMTCDQYALWGPRASARIDRLTLGRAAAALAAHPEELAGPLADACGQIADLLAAAQTAQSRAANGLTAAGTDGYTETYGAAHTAAGAAAAACRSALADALGADPFNLLYQGVGGC